MTMDINSRIDWHPGMEINSGILKLLDRQTYEINRQAISLILGMPASNFTKRGLRGRLNGTVCECHPAFVRRSIEIAGLKLTALLPSCRIVDVDEDVIVPIDSLEEDELYVAVGVSTEEVSYEVQDVPMKRPKYSYGIYTHKEVKEGDLMPIVRLYVEDGSLAIDQDYIIPPLFASADEGIMRWHGEMTEKVTALSCHKNLEESDLKYLLAKMAHFMSVDLADTNGRHLLPQMEKALGLLRKCLDAYLNVHGLSGEKPVEVAVPQLDTLNPSAFCKDVKKYFQYVENVLEIVIVVDRTIDFDTLKSQVRTELFEVLHPEMEQRLESMRTQLRQELLSELDNRIKQAVREACDELRMQIKDELDDELSASLHAALYQSLYDALYDALYVKMPKDNDDFMPLI